MFDLSSAQMDIRFSDSFACLIFFLLFFSSLTCPASALPSVQMTSKLPSIVFSPLLSSHFLSNLPCVGVDPQIFKHIQTVQHPAPAGFTPACKRRESPSTSAEKTSPGAKRPEICALGVGPLRSSSCLADKLRFRGS